MSYCGYIDMLGTKNLAEESISDLLGKMEWFHTSLLDYFDIYRHGKCVAASDGAFFENKNKDDFYPYYQRFRNYLFDKDVFFKCSYVPGEIGFIPETKGGNSIQNYRFLSLNFSKDSSKAYREEALLKGVGCNVSGFDDGLVLKNTFINFCIDKVSGKFIPVKFVDFTFSEFEISGEGDSCVRNWPSEQRILDRILYTISLVSMNSNIVAAKYIPLLINFIRSSNFENVKFEDSEWVDAPYVLRRFVCTGSPISSFSRVPGLRYVLLALYDKMFADSNGEIQMEAEEKLVRFVMRRKDCQSDLGSVPHFVITPPARKRLVKCIAEYKGLKLQS